MRNIQMKKRIVILMSVVLFAFSGCSDSSSSANKTISRSITPAEALSMMKNKSNLLVVDVRSPQELRSGYIEGSELIPFWEIARGKRSLPADRPILLVCAVGGRSYGVGQLLARNGWPEIYNLSGGTSAWKRAGLPLQY
jgi:rhodanese-related sulfurtransferase